MLQRCPVRLLFQDSWHISPDSWHGITWIDRLWFALSPSFSPSFHLSLFDSFRFFQRLFRISIRAFILEERADSRHCHAILEILSGIFHFSYHFLIRFFSFFLSFFLSFFISFFLSCFFFLFLILITIIIFFLECWKRGELCVRLQTIPVARFSGDSFPATPFTNTSRILLLWAHQRLVRILTEPNAADSHWTKMMNYQRAVKTHAGRLYRLCHLSIFYNRLRLPSQQHKSTTLRDTSKILNQTTSLLDNKYNNNTIIDAINKSSNNKSSGDDDNDKIGTEKKEREEFLVAMFGLSFLMGRNGSDGWEFNDYDWWRLPWNSSNPTGNDPHW